MKYQALSHYKFRRLHAILGLPSTAYTAGHLELIWAHAHQTQPDIKCVEVEFIADWYGEPGKLLEALIECGWLDIVDDSTVQVHDYADHAPSYVKKRDYQKEYMREYRQRKDLLDSVRPNTPNVSPNTSPVSTLLDVVSIPTQPNITKPNITKNTEEERVPLSTANAAPHPVIQAWNDMASECGLPKAQSTKKRMTALKVRMNEPPFRDGWKEAIAKIPSSKFLTGDNDRGWRADLDWFLKPDSVVRIIEGKYDGHGKQHEIAEAIKKAQDDCDGITF